MTKSKRINLASTTVILSLCTGGAMAADPGYWSDVSGDRVVNSFGECWQGLGGAGIPDCGDVAVTEPEVEADSDGDGVPDSRDRCPETPAAVKVDSDGCPLDSDGDGVSDYLDNCPGTPAGAVVNAQGCVDRVVMDDLTFETGKAELTRGAVQLLDSVAGQVVGNPAIHAIEITGHTDNTGSARFNQRLSEMRARAVSDYFTRIGIPAGIITTKGMGMNHPIADNGDVEGRSRNRRVEIDFRM